MKRLIDYISESSNDYSNIKSKVIGGDFPKKVKLPINYLNGKIVNDTVNVVYAVEDIKLVIICKFDNGYQDFYYDDDSSAFYPLSENYTDYKGKQLTFKDYWKEEKLGVECPKEYENEVACLF